MNALLALRPCKAFGRSTSGIHARPRKRVRFCCSVKPSQLWWGLFPSRTINEIFRTIPLAFRRARVCVCFFGFASVRNFGHTRLRHPCLARSSRCTEPLHSHNHCKRTTILCLALHSCHMNALLALRPAKPLGVQLRASMPALEKGEVARL